MKKQNYLQKTSFLLLLLLSVACSDDDSSVDAYANRNVRNIEINKQNAYVDDEITLNFDTSNNESIVVTSEDPNISITSTSDTSYTLSSSQTASGFVTITTTNGEESQIDQILVNFHEHVTTDYETIEGITMGVSNIYHLILLLGEPDDIVKNTVVGVNETTGEPTYAYFENWYYFSRGISFYTTPSRKVIISATLYGTTWGVTVDGEIKQGVRYEHDIADLGNFANTNGILMDDVIAKFGAVVEEDKSASESGDQVRYVYPDVNATLDGTQTANFLFNSTSIDDYQGKSVVSITFN